MLSEGTICEKEEVMLRVGVFWEGREQEGSKFFFYYVTANWFGFYVWVARDSEAWWQR